MEDTKEKSININMEEENSDGKLELSLRILGNEIIGFKMVVDDFKIKFLLGGIAALGIIAYIMVVFGPQLMETFSG
mgnify:CR=1 FL=1|jgi:hypothetical protein|tara:strand:- start:1105 stop:1332 length:228 start_codon:yes stop_codon:yes gene_type:complete